MNKNSRGFAPVVVILALVIMGIVGFYIIKPITTQLEIPGAKKLENKQITLPNQKVYTNDYYHFSLKMPDNWTVEEFIKDNGYPGFKLSSPDGTLVIENPRTSDAETPTGVSYPPGMSSVKLGGYIVETAKYTNGLGDVWDYISLSLPNQKKVDLYVRIDGDKIADNNLLLDILSTFEFTQQEPDLATYINFNIPAGWERQSLINYYETTDKLISLTSPDYEILEGSYIKTGANIRVERFKKDPRKSLREIAIFGLEKEALDEAAEKSLTIGRLPALNIFTCWEGCTDSYYIEQDKYYWEVVFFCDPVCSQSKALMDASKYGKDRDIFLNSIKFN